jgi:cytochrome b561
MDTPLARLPASLRWMHWAAVLLVALAYLTGESAEDGGGAAWHYFAGWVLIAVFAPRAVLHWRHRRSLESHMPGPGAGFARLVQALLLAFVLVQPVLGILALWGEGHAVPLPFTPWVLPSPFAGEFGEWPEELHEALGNAFYAVIALHAGVALWHHFVGRDPVLRRML